jgi:hypothetical protein
MNDRDAPHALPATSAIHQYLLVSLAALGVMLLVLLYWGMGRWSFLPVLIGLMGVILRWRLTDPGRPALDRGIARIMSPLVTVVLLAVLLLSSEAMELPARGTTAGFSLPDWLLSGAVLALCLAQYRLLSMTVSIFPEAPSGRPARPAQAPSTSAQPRNPQRATPTEISWLVLSLPIWAFLAQLCWRLLPTGDPPYDLSERAWQGIVLLWLLVSSALFVAGLRSYADQRRLSRREARLFLQDAFWQETGPEQRRVCRWLAWARLRRRRKEKS